jgi:acetyltransferase-like isoleucine patch superfamily enzyme
MNAARTLPWDWYEGTVPDNVVYDESVHLASSYIFYLYRSEAPVGVRIGRGTAVYMGSLFDVGQRGSITLGEYVLVNGARFTCDSEITVGDHCLISWNVVFMDTYRMPSDPEGRRREVEHAVLRSPRRLGGDAEARPIHIGNNVWIGFDSCVLPGVTIGEGSIVGARSVVTEDVPPYTVVAGNPARVIRYLAPLDTRST